MMKITGLSHLFKWENLHNWWLTKYFFAPLYLKQPLEGSYEHILSKRAVGTMNLDCWMSDSGAFFRYPGRPPLLAIRYPMKEPQPPPLQEGWLWP